MQFKLEGTIVPKARPRFANGHSYLPDRYRKWKNQAAIALREQNSYSQPLVMCRITIIFLGSHNRNADLDNLAGAVLDALVDAKVIEDDRLSVVRELTTKFPGTKGKKETTIEIEPL